jgi:hypothetical protein
MRLDGDHAARAPARRLRSAPHERARHDLLTRYLLAEAALSVAEFDVAEQLIEGAGLAPGQVSAPTGDGEPDATGAPEGALDGAALTSFASAAQRIPGRAAQAQVSARVSPRWRRRTGARLPGDRRDRRVRSRPGW